MRLCTAASTGVRCLRVCVAMRILLSHAPAVWRFFTYLGPVASSTVSASPLPLHRPTSKWPPTQASTAGAGGVFRIFTREQLATFLSIPSFFHHPRTLSSSPLSLGIRVVTLGKNAMLNARRYIFAYLILVHISIIVLQIVQQQEFTVTFSVTALLTIGIRFRLALSHHHPFKRKLGSLNFHL